MASDAVVEVDCDALLRELTAEVVKKTRPTLVKREGNVSTVAYTLEPLIVLLEVTDGNVRLVSVSKTMSEDVVAVMDSEGDLSIDTPERCFPVDRLLNSSTYDSVVNDFKELTDKLKETSNAGR